MRAAPAQGVGVGLRVPHYRDFLERRPDLGWIEIHSENYLSRAGWDWHVLCTLRRDYPVSLHGVGLGLGSAGGFPEQHLRRVRALVDAVEPALVSEHLSWGALPGRQLHDLLPLRFDDAALALVTERVRKAQDALGRRLLIENVSAYLRFNGDVLAEGQFLAELARRTGCGILLDVNNLYVNGCNHGEDPHAALDALAALPAGCVGEIHLGGHAVTPHGLVDHHGDRVAPPVWDLYRAALARFGAVPTLIEWDADIPPLDVLLDEAAMARRIAGEVTATGCAAIAPPPAFVPMSVSTGQPDAAQLQGLFGAALLGSGETAPLAPWLRDADNAAGRLAIYRGNLGAAWHRALCATYPVLRRLAGEEAFAGLSRAYGRAHPSQDPDLNGFGEGLPEFLATDIAHDYPYFPDMARLEWLVHTAHGAPDAAPPTPAPLPGSIDPAAFEASRPVLHPALRLYTSPWATAALWHAHRPGGAPWPDDLHVPTHALVLRAGWQVDVVALDVAEHAALAQLAAGGTFGMALDDAYALDEDFDAAAAVHRWLTGGIVTGLQPAPPT
jgi:uncharacterized protein (UPF0276 family)